MGIRDIPVPPILVIALMMGLCAFGSWALAWAGEWVRRLVDYLSR